MTMNDMELVQQYARSRSEEAFATLVARNVSLVYSVAFRQVRDTQMAEEITQTVFIILARKASSLNSKTIVSGWLCRTARFVASRAFTMQKRRENREQQAYLESIASETNGEAWRQIEHLLDGAMEKLDQKDHDALVLRFFEGHSFETLSEALGTTEAGAKMRVKRALEKLRLIFLKQGLTFSVGVIAGAVSTQSVQAAPIGLATSSTAAALQGITGTSTLTLTKTSLKLMAWTKIKTAAVVGIILLGATGAVTLTHYQQPVLKKSATFKFAGYATPEATMESMIWAAGQGDLEKFMNAFTQDEAERFRNQMLAGRPREEVRRKAIALANAMIGYKIIRKEIISDNEIHVYVTAPPSPDGLRSGRNTLIVKKVGNEWKRAGDID